MTPHLLLMTAVVVPAGGLSLPYSLTISDTASTATLDSTDGAHPTVAAGTYRPQRFLEACASALRASIFARLVADAFVTVEPAGVSSVTVTLGPASAPLTPGTGTALLALTLGGSLGSGAGGPISITGISLLNASSQWCALGLAWAAETRTVSASSVTGRFAPRWITVPRASFTWSERQEIPGYSARLLGDGSVDVFTLRRPALRRYTLSLRDHLSTALGPALPISTFASFGGGRHVLNFQTVTGALLSNVNLPTKKTDVVPVGAYLRVGGYSARLREISGDAATLAEPIPSDVTVSVGEPVEWVSEVAQWHEESARAGLCFFGARDDESRGAAWLSPAYALDGEDGLTLAPVARSLSARMYSVDIPLLLVPRPDLT